MTTFAYVFDDTEDRSDVARFHIGELPSIDHWIADKAGSDSIKVRSRPGFRGLQKAVQAGDTLIVSSVDRLGVSPEELVELLQAFKAQGVRIVSVQEGFDLDSPDVKKTLQMVAEITTFNRAIIRALGSQEWKWDA
jgi:DNA invertase Pin-like site-specific DNA recombinase